MRKLASQVPEAVSRLHRSTLLQAPPTWYLPVLSNPPPIQPSRSTVPRSNKFDLYPQSNPSSSKTPSSYKMKHLREKKPKAREIVYEEDRIRRQFFSDFPFEALRPVSLVEGREIRSENEVNGLEWIRLEQRGAYSTVEDTIAFVVNLHNVHQRPLTESYTIATSEFAELRARHEMATLAAEAEARAYGTEFTSDPFRRVFNKNEQSLSTLTTSSSISDSSSSSGKYRKPTRWTAIIPEEARSSEEFSGGRMYMQNWSLPPPLELEETSVESKAMDTEVDELPEIRRPRSVEEEDLSDAEILERELSRVRT